MFGLYVRGNTNHLIIGDDYPVLTQRYSGPIMVTDLPEWPSGITGRYFDENGDEVVELLYYYERPPSYGYCNVVYPEVIRTELPPMIFGVPTSLANDRGIGAFCHRGGPGAWTGFSVLVTRHLFASSYTAMSKGFNSGWTYRVCVFGDPGVAARTDTFGLRMWAADGRATFDSRWPIVPFRGLLGNWQMLSPARDSFTRSYAIYAYWGYRYVRGDEDYVLIKGYHPWGAADGSLGILLSGIGFVPLRHDVGSSDHTHAAVVTVGFPSGARDRIWSVAYEGMSQHPAGDVSAMNSWRLLTADFTYT